MARTKEQRLELIRQVQQHVRDELELELGDLSAGFLIDFFDTLLSPSHYNEALDDARAVIGRQLQLADDELFALRRVAQTTPRSAPPAVREVDPTPRRPGRRDS